MNSMAQYPWGNPPPHAEDKNIARVATVAYRIAEEMRPIRLR